MQYGVPAEKVHDLVQLQKTRLKGKYCIEMADGNRFLGVRIGFNQGAIEDEPFTILISKLSIKFINVGRSLEILKDDLIETHSIGENGLEIRFTNVFVGERTWYLSFQTPQIRDQAHQLLNELSPSPSPEVGPGNGNDGAPKTSPISSDPLEFSDDDH